MYVNLFLLCTAPLPDDEAKTSIQLIMEDGETLILYPYRFEGGQRLLLPSEASDFIITLLSEGKSFTIKVGRNELAIVPENFQISYENLMSVPIATIE